MSLKHYLHHVTFLVQTGTIKLNQRNESSKQSSMRTESQLVFWMVSGGVMLYTACTAVLSSLELNSPQDNKWFCLKF